LLFCVRRLSLWSGCCPDLGNDLRHTFRDLACQFRGRAMGSGELSAKARGRKDARKDEREVRSGDRLR